ncbi:MAG: SpoIIE family protein phosphatase [Planctomycetaceae bacterium]|nr:SpoIIE family protein phosphatase [Planctomycetales bacterium]MCB9926701.1 SpoIIE family protein phosphatase [Planctomycetaceae bacterium]
MRILAVWDNETEAELISMYLDVDENEVTMTTTPAAFCAAIVSGNPYDIVLMTIGLPDPEAGFELFELVQEHYPDAPVVGACPQSEVFHVVRFMANGMSAYVTRDSGGDYIFMLSAILNSTLDAVRSAREKELTKKLREEVESVRKLQESVLPRNLVAPAGYRICARYEPSRIRVVDGHPVVLAGGDYYDVFTLSDDNIVLLVGDAAGHGMKSCLSIMTMHTLVRMMRRQEHRDPAHFVAEINKGLCDQATVTDKGGFITLLYAIMNTETRTLQWASAGHQPPLLQDLSTGIIEPLAGQDAGGLPLAVDEDEEYETYVCRLPDKFRLMLFTDGLEEAFPEGDDDNQFGLDGIVRTLGETKDLSLEDTLARLFDASNDFTRGSGRKDDTSVLLLERHG